MDTNLSAAAIITEKIKLECAYRAVARIRVAIDTLRWAGYCEEADDLERVSGPIAKLAGWTVWGGNEL